jgi:SAM-dependent methyltransferase
MKDLSVNPKARLQQLRNPWWFPDHLVVAPLWRDLQTASRHAFGRLLDLGCGNAPYRDWFVGQVQHYVTADHPPVSPAVQVACDMQHLPFANGSFDTVLCTQVLEHIPRPWLAAGEIMRILKPGGILILSCPQYWVLHEIPHDYFRFTPYGLRVLFPEGNWNWLLHRQQGSTWAVIACALWQSFNSFGRSRKLISILLNPLFLALDRYWQTPRDTTNHLIVLRREPHTLTPNSTSQRSVS